MRKSKSLAAYKKRLWTIFSEYIRRRDADEDGNVSCFTCGKVSHWKEMDAGHYHHRNSGLSLFFDERNVQVQDTFCNRFRHGNLTAYAVNLRKKYGEGILEELEGMRHDMKKIGTVGYQEMIEEYKKKLESL